jgi:hypothetical protein
MLGLNLTESQVTIMNKDSAETSDEDLANDRWENEGGHTEYEIGTGRLWCFVPCCRSPH